MSEGQSSLLQVVPGDRFGVGHKRNPHVLKTWPTHFQAIVDGVKRFEARRDDRGIRAGDWLLLREYEPEHDRFTGREELRKVTYILHGGIFGIEEGYAVFSLGGRLV